MSKPDHYKVTIVGSVIASCGPKVLLDDLEAKAKNLKLDSVDEISLEDRKGNKIGKRKPQVHR